MGNTTNMKKEDIIDSTIYTAYKIGIYPSAAPAGFCSSVIIIQKRRPYIICPSKLDRILYPSRQCLFTQAFQLPY